MPYKNIAGDIRDDGYGEDLSAFIMTSGWDNTVQRSDRRETAFGDGDFTSGLIKDSIQSAQSDHLLMLSPEDSAPLRAQSLSRAMSACVESTNDHIRIIRALGTGSDVDMAHSLVPENMAKEQGCGRDDDESRNSSCRERLSYMLEQILSHGKPIEEVVVEMRHATFVQSLALARTISRSSMEAPTSTIQ